MGGEESRRDRNAGARMLRLRADGCLLCIALDVVDGVFTDADECGGSSEVAIVDWAEVSGVPRRSAPPGETCLVVVRTRSGRVGLRTDSCIGVRDVSVLESPPMPTRMLGNTGRPLCYLMMIDRRPHFLIEPHALSDAARQDGSRRGEPAEVGSIPPSVAIGG